MRSSPVKLLWLALGAGIVFSGAAFAEPLPQPAVDVSPAPTATPHRLENISARAVVQRGNNVLIAGIIITGNAPKHVILRALGPSLSVNGSPIPGRLADPTLDLYVAGSTAPIAQNNDWQETQRAQIIATGIPPTNDLESAIVMTLDPGQYTAIVRDRTGGSGTALLEAYDLDPQPAASKLANISTRGFAGVDNDALIGGLIAGGGAADGSIRVVIRALGPSLATQGVSDALADPTLNLFNAQGTSLGSNDNWGSSDQAMAIEQNGLAPTNDAEAVVVAVLPAGNYTAVLRGRNQSTGTALIEVYDVPEVIPH